MSHGPDSQWGHEKNYTYLFVFLKSRKLFFIKILNLNQLNQNEPGLMPTLNVSASAPPAVCL